ncbi:MAG TPA: 2-oxo acid dehydrogenase subunit E2, partial [Blastocatellia bacterium]|nr:2-oxo acid dehydrogenase subunit E2 [Blastocatellia bacterium]
MRVKPGRADTEKLEAAIAEEFGANADYVADLLRQYQRDPASIDDEWRAYFDSLSASRDSGKPGEPENLGPIAGSVATSRVIEQHEARAAVDRGERTPLRGPAMRLAENMDASLAVPTATSLRQVPIKLLDENRRLMNRYLSPAGKHVSFTAIIAAAIVRALETFPQLADFYEEVDGVAYRVHPTGINLGIAVDVTRKDGTRALLVPNIKNAGALSFQQLVATYDDIVSRARDGRLQVVDFQGTTISITNPGTIGTTSSSPRLLAGQGLIVASGAIEYPPEFQAMAPEALSRLGISKVIVLTSTYDHRITQGAESGAFLRLIDELLRGQNQFYDRIFAELGVPFQPYHWAVDRNPALLGEEAHRAEVRKQARVFELINAYRVRGHLIADIDPLGWKKLQSHPELDIQSYDLTIWDLDREFVSGGLGGTEAATLRQILDQLRRFYCGKVGVEYRH